MKKNTIVSLLLAAVLLLSACGQTTQSQIAYVEEAVMGPVLLDKEAAALDTAQPAAAPQLLLAQPSGKLTKKGTEAIIDYSNTADGYVMVQYTAQTAQRLKVRVQGPATTYTYNLTPNRWTVFPLSDGSGSYQVTVFRNVSGTKYANVLSCTMQVQLTDEFAPFLRPNQYVDYNAATKAVELAAQLTQDSATAFDKVALVYDYVVGNFSYDYEKAKTVQSGYLPVLDSVLESKKGICFDYAALMCGMLRSQGVPCKLVVGYAGTTYHAWISVWSEQSGWIDGAIWFDGTTWRRLDPTFASSGGSSKSILDFINKDENYTVKYLY